MIADEDDDLGTTAVHRVTRERETDPPESTGVSRALVAEAKASGYESAEAIYRAVASLRDSLSPEAQKQLAVCFEWAREGIALQSGGEVSEEFKALHAAYGYARDVMLAAAKKGARK